MMFHTFIMFPKPGKVFLDDNRCTVPALGQGRVYLADYLFLDEVLYVPSFPTRLLSVRSRPLLRNAMYSSLILCATRYLALGSVRKGCIMCK